LLGDTPFFHSMQTVIRQIFDENYQFALATTISVRAKRLLCMYSE